MFFILIIRRRRKKKEEVIFALPKLLTALQKGNVKINPHINLIFALVRWIDFRTLL